MKIYHLNCGILHAPPNPQAACHCLLIEQDGRLTLIDTGIGLRDIAEPLERIGQPAIEAAGFQFHELLTAVRQIEAFGFPPEALTDIVLTHCDPDHIGGLADFPTATVHISAEERQQLELGHGRYSPAQFAHQPRWASYPISKERWYGIESRPIMLDSGIDIRLIPLFGHTLGHCGVAVRHQERWLLHVGDAYYLRIELETDDHPVSVLAAQRADDDLQWRMSLSELRRLARDHKGEINLFGYHDFTELSIGTFATGPKLADHEH